MAELHRRRLALVGGLASVLLGVVLWGGDVVPAVADTFPGNYDGRVADSYLHTYCFLSTFSGYEAVGHYAMRNALDNTTQMTDVFQSCTNNTDVWFQRANLSPGVRGSRVCSVPTSSTVCNRSTITLDFAEIDRGSNDWHDRRKTSVHEVGHSVGLDHDTVSAMISGEVPSTALVWRRYSNHDIAHINNQY